MEDFCKVKGDEGECEHTAGQSVDNVKKPQDFSKFSIGSKGIDNLSMGRSNCFPFPAFLFVFVISVGTINDEFETFNACFSFF